MFQEMEENWSNSEAFISQSINQTKNRYHINKSNDEYVSICNIIESNLQIISEVEVSGLILISD